MKADAIGTATEATELLAMWRGLVIEGGVPRYTVLPGAALNTLVGWTDGYLRRSGKILIVGSKGDA